MLGHKVGNAKDDAQTEHGSSNVKEDVHQYYIDDAGRLIILYAVKAYLDVSARPKRTGQKEAHRH